MLSLVDIRARIEGGTLTPAAAIAEARAAIAEREPRIGAIAHLAEDVAVPETGPLAGIAVGVKDIIDTAEMPTQMGSPLYAGWRPRADAAIVARLKGLGGVALAKTVTCAFAGLDPSPTRNPHDPARTPGGSSAGSAAAVAAGMLPLALGTQTGGSVIRPASFCGVAAIKPSFRLLPMVGVKTFSWALDTLGLFGAGVRDVAHALALLSGREGIDLGGTPPGAPRIGLVRQEFAGEAQPEAERTLERAVRAAERGGARVTALTLPDPLPEAFRRHGVIQDFEALQALGWEYANGRAALPPVLGAQLDRAQALSAAEYDDARRHAHRARRALKDLFSEYDALLTFSATGIAPGPETTGDPRFNRLWTLMGVPCVTLPVPGEALPVGVQVIARFGDDGRALAAARLIEAGLAAG
ncbi:MULTISPECIES: amidase [Methylobacterium]|uniref:Glutamyl-tRNA(Gln) amidotransferase subunit A n=1 Tax=Methylobacterium jeotgali TaxID=381630 RepID=A0ABQ4T1H9_9HYPH|nr:MULTISPECIES: amidase [Methylobacterium]PIU06172.1 MAG: amidase [Methylobacterium sp. CG09_land_8_20_14_0_10_71_15]PIU14463.1 MAG: amidase [Methylobacterium sp. CG08_land_8_20_14_0_20_71_15]GBU18218.1 amidase [Methylobacterium sp.]GJE08090.1 Glutamyl-tRNA(Gln) amidotransferase subunit A [Methylobacterium jeotgali]